jgi:hypothetical protein
LCALVRLTVTPTPLVSVSLFKGVFSANEAGRGLMRGRVWKGRESSAKEQGRLAESCMGGARDSQASSPRAMMDDLMARLVDRWVKRESAAANTSVMRAYQHGDPAEDVEGDEPLPASAQRRPRPWRRRTRARSRPWRPPQPASYIIAIHHCRHHH